MLEVLEVFFVNGTKVDGSACLQQHKGMGVGLTEKFAKTKEEVSERECKSRSNK